MMAELTHLVFKKDFNINLVSLDPYPALRRGFLSAK